MIANVIKSDVTTYWMNGKNCHSMKKRAEVQKNWEKTTTTMDVLYYTSCTLYIDSMNVIGERILVYFSFKRIDEQIEIERECVCTLSSLCNLYTVIAFPIGK